MKVIPNDFGAHHRLSSSGLVQASNTRRAGASKVRVTTSSRSDVRSTVVFFFMGSVSLLASIDPVLSLQLIDNIVQRIETRRPKLAVPLDPGRLFLEPAQPELASAHAPDFFRRDQ